VSGSARVYDSAQVSGSARVYDSAQVSGSAQVCGSARVVQSNDVIAIGIQPYNITITPQNIVIGCQIRSRFGSKKERSFLDLPEATEELKKRYLPLLKSLRILVPRRR
jgi:hypothetical protein